MVERIRELCSSRGTTIAQLERELGLSKASISKWDESRPSIDKVQKVSNYFGLTVSELLNEEIKTPVSDNRDGLIDALSTLREEERALLQVARGMTAEDVAAVTAFIKQLKGNNDSN